MGLRTVYPSRCPKIDYLPLFEGTLQWKPWGVHAVTLPSKTIGAAVRVREEKNHGDEGSWMVSSPSSSS
ncbi:hypothetical protein TNCV_2272941 [Trichonephila clavipes]|nr:hypothetical protein TNCV_2272941 [Trichonephila clavipes]